MTPGKSEQAEGQHSAVPPDQVHGSMMAVLSHEMRTPLNGVVGAVELLSATALDKRQRRYVEIIQTSADLLLSLVNNVLDLSRADSGKFMLATSDFDLEDLIFDLAEGMRGQAAARGNRLVLEAPEGGDWIMCGDPARLRQVLVNLLGNAIKFTRNGTITIAIDRSEEDDEFEIRVIDTGIGIRAQDIDSVFAEFVTLDPTFRREAEGSGLGLAITKRLVELMDGRIGVESVYGSGTEFWVRVPVAVAAEHQPLKPVADRAAAAPSVIPDGLRVLVVEDNDINRLLVREMLTQQGCLVTEARNGREGVEFAAMRAFDLILMDISMTEMDGISAMQAIRAGDGPNRAGPIVAMTAHAFPSDVARFLEAGMTEVLSKPVTRARLMQKLSVALSAAADPTPAETGVAETRLATAELIETLGPEAASAVLAQARAELEDGMAGLRDLIDNRAGAGEIARLAHRLSGTAGMMGLGKATSAFARIEAGAGQADGQAMLSNLALAEQDIAREVDLESP